MRQASVILFNAAAATANGTRLFTNQAVSASFQVFCSGSDAGGTLKIQASNDPTNVGNLNADAVVTNWTDIPNATVTITAGSGGLITIGQMCYNWVRPVFTQTAGAGASIVTCQANYLSV